MVDRLTEFVRLPSQAALDQAPGKLECPLEKVTGATERRGRQSNGTCPENAEGNASPTADGSPTQKGLAPKSRVGPAYERRSAATYFLPSLARQPTSLRAGLMGRGA